MFNQQQHTVFRVYRVCLSHVPRSISTSSTLTGFKGSIAALRSSSSMFLLQSGQTHSGAC